MWGTASALLWSPRVMAGEGRRGAQAARWGQGARESQSLGAPAFTLGAEQNSLCPRKEDGPSE